MSENPDKLVSPPKPFVPIDYQIPTMLATQYFRARMLTVNDVVKDYDAVISSVDHLRMMFPLSDWPDKNMTLEQNLIDLGWHQKEFQTRSSFAYTVVRLDESEVLGCLYIDPSTKRGFDAVITMWVRASVLANGLDSILYSSVKDWVANEWPFKNVVYPGREIDWQEWKRLK